MVRAIATTSFVPLIAPPSSLRLGKRRSSGGSQGSAQPSPNEYDSASPSVHAPFLTFFRRQVPEGRREEDESDGKNIQQQPDG